MNDFKFAFRQLAKNPGFTAVAVLTLALCIGANSAIFSVVHAVLLRPLSYPDSERLVFVNNSYPGNDLLKANVSIPDYLDRVERAPSIEAAMLYDFQSFNLAGEEGPTRVMGLRTTPSMFDTLQVAPMLGRPFDEVESQPGSENVVVLSHSLWSDRFGGRESVIGESIRLHGNSHTVIGVMPEGFDFPAPEVRLWVPHAFTAEQRSDQERGNEYSTMLARLKPGATPDQLRQECTTIIAQNLERLPEARSYVESTGFTALITPILDDSVEGVTQMLWLVQAGVIAALLIGCANVGNLLLTRVVARGRELAIRSALGAGGWRLARQLGVETFVLFFTGGTLGWFVAMWGLSGVDAFGVADLPRGASVSLNLTVFFFTIASVVLTGLAFGLLPALHGTRSDPADALRDSGTRTSANRSQVRVRHGLVIAEMALAVMLLTTAGLLYHSMARLQQQNPGFDHASTLTARLTLPAAKYSSDEQRIVFGENVVSELTALPGIDSVGFIDAIPFGFINPQGTYGIAGQERSDGAPPPHGQIRSVSQDYFASMGIPLLRGRTFSTQDNADGDSVVVIDRVLADRYFQGRDPIGQQIYRNGNQPQNMRTVVGVVAAVKHYGLDDLSTKETIYFPYKQRPVESVTLVARTALDPSELIYAVRQAVMKLDPEQPLFDIQTLSGRIDGTLQRRKAPMRLLGIFSGMALLLASLGVYGVLAFNVGQRNQEFGIRAALGATAGDVSGLVMRQGLRLVGVGIAIGMGGYIAISQFLRSLVFDITPLDPVSLLLGPLVLLAVAILACWLPSRRASKVNPVEALRIT